MQISTKVMVDFNSTFFNSTFFNYIYIYSSLFEKWVRFLIDYPTEMIISSMGMGIVMYIMYNIYMKCQEISYLKQKYTDLEKRMEKMKYSLTNDYVFIGFGNAVNDESCEGLPILVSKKIKNTRELMDKIIGGSTIFISQLHHLSIKQLDFIVMFDKYNRILLKYDDSSVNPIVRTYVESHSEDEVNEIKKYIQYFESHGIEVIHVDPMFYPGK
jgi:hypothetical protein